jgi:hypothetical protein
MNRREFLLGAAATTTTPPAVHVLRGMDLDHPPFILPPPENLAPALPADELRFLHLCADNAPAIFAATDRPALVAAFGTFWAAVEKSGIALLVKGWMGRMLDTRATGKGMAPRVALWPGVVLRAEGAPSAGEAPGTYIPGNAPLYRRILPIPPDMRVRFDAEITGGLVDGTGLYPYPLTFTARFTAMDPVVGD